MRPQNIAKSEEFELKIKDLDIDKMVFFDETSIYVERPRNSGWSPVGEAVLGVAHPSPAKMTHILGAMTVNGVIAWDECSENLCQDTVIPIVRYQILPKLPKDCIFVLDGASFHGRAFREMLIEEGVQYLYLPPYSPERNPIELAWSLLKRSIENITWDCKGYLKAKLREVFEEINVHAEQLIAHAGYAHLL